MPRTAREVVRSYLVISGLFTLGASVIWGVYTLFLLDSGLDILGAFIANAAFTGGMALFEVPTGVVADTYGRRTSFVIGGSTLFVGTVGFIVIRAAGGGLVPLVIASLVLGMGYAFYSGSVEAWLVDALHFVGYEGPLDKVFAKGSMVSGAAMLVGSVSGGLLGTIDLAWPFAVRAVLLIVVVALAFRLMPDLGFTPRTTSLSALPAETRRIFHDGVTFGWRSRSVRLLMMVSFVQGGFMIWGFYAWQPYLLELFGRDAPWLTGVVSACIALATIGGNELVEIFASRCGKRTTLLLSASAVMGLAAAGVGAFGRFWPSVILLLVAMGAMGVSSPVQQAYLHQIVPSAQRATVISFVSLVGSTGGIGGSLGLGDLSRSQSVGTGYVAGGLATLLALPSLLFLRKRGDPADVIVGERAGKRAPCAAQGIPEVAVVDATPRQPEAAGAV